MRVLVIEPFSGISGDMFLGALISTGVSAKLLEQKIKDYGVKGFKLKVSEKKVSGLQATKLEVKGGNKLVFRNSSDFNKFVHELSLTKDILKQLKNSIRTVLRIERCIHGSTHIHELGMLDTIVDLLGSIIGVEMLGVKKVYTFPINVGDGFVTTSHGLIPIPAPVTLELLKGYTIYKEGKGELTTPTGALILKLLSAEPVSNLRFTPVRCGYGAGTYSGNQFPDVLRIWLCEEVKSEIMVVECNIDDMNPQYFSSLFDALFSTGAIDIFVSFGLMKKGRPGFMLSVLCEKSELNSVLESIFKNTTTIGIRYYSVNRVELQREIDYIETKYGKVRVKKAFFEDKCVNLSYEFSDVQKIAKKSGKTPKEVLKELVFKY